MGVHEREKFKELLWSTSLLFGENALLLCLDFQVNIGKPCSHYLGPWICFLDSSKV